MLPLVSITDVTREAAARRVDERCSRHRVLPGILAAAALALSPLLTATPASAAVAIPPELSKLSCGRCLSEADARNRFAPEEWLQLEAGDVVTREQAADGKDAKENRQTEASGIVSWPPQLVWDVLVDFDSRTKFMSTSTKSEITRIDGNDVRVDQALKILWEKIQFSVINHVDPATGRISWTMDKEKEHNIADTVGAWQIVPLDGGRHTLLLYTSHTDTGRPVPAMIESYVIKRSLPKMIEAVRDEVARRGKGSSYVLPNTE